MINSSRSLRGRGISGLDSFRSSIRATLKFCGLLLLACASAQPAWSAPAGSRFEWKQIEPGFSFGKYELGSPNSVIRPEVFLLKFDLNYFSLSPTVGDESAPETYRGADVQTLTKKVGGVAGINGNFFDEKGQPLGLVISDGATKHKIQRGGGVLTGVFFVSQGKAGIIHRDNFNAGAIDAAVQGGPRLVESGKPIQLSSDDETSRRTGIAINKRGEVIIYATVLRFPGASLRDIQTMLIDPALEITHALNLDGGGSSQLFVESSATLQGETFITGGDSVPVALVAKRKPQ